MLYRLELENFYSVRLPQALDLRVADNVPDEPERLDPVFKGSKERAARVIAIFGPNASGKTTVLKAIAFLRWFISDSDRGSPDAGLPCERFNDAFAATAPMRLAIEFGGRLDLTSDPPDDTTEYGAWRYELEMQPGPNRITVVSEVLRQRPAGKSKWARSFERVGNKVKAARSFNISGFSPIVNKVRDNASLISTLAHINHKPSLALRSAALMIAGNVGIDRFEYNDDIVAPHYASNDFRLKTLNREIQRIDVGIKRMYVDQTANGPIAMFEHEGLELPMPMSLESRGTRTFIKYFPLIDMAFESGGLALIDEIDVSIHPLILPEIIKWFHDPKRNPHRAQLWITCHAASLLEDLLKEEIFFCEKDKLGRTSIFGLQDIQNVRRTDNRYRKYLSGVYGAIPQIG